MKFPMKNLFLALFAKARMAFQRLKLPFLESKV